MPRASTDEVGLRVVISTIASDAVAEAGFQKRTVRSRPPTHSHTPAADMLAPPSRCPLARPDAHLGGTSHNRRNAKQVGNENKPKMQPIVHLMCKALPQRCQIRNLREIISNYCQTDDLVHEFMRSALICSLLGMYQHCKTRLSWKARKKIIHRFIYSKPNRMQLQEWLFTTYQHLLFYIIKEFFFVIRI